MKPIHFNTEMVKAILDGRKTQTRREPVILQDIEIPEEGFIHQCPDGTMMGRQQVLRYNSHGQESIDVEWINFPIIPKYKVGDILYVKEAFTLFDDDGEFTYIYYKADHQKLYYDTIKKWKSPRYMPKEAARIFLKVTDVRVERLQEITPPDIQKEGYQECTDVIHNICSNRHHCKVWYTELWDTIYKKKGFGWDTNPFVTVVTFERIEKPQEEE